MHTKYQGSILGKYSLFELSQCPRHEFEEWMGVDTCCSGGRAAYRGRTIASPHVSGSKFPISCLSSETACMKPFLGHEFYRTQWIVGHPWCSQPLGIEVSTPDRHSYCPMRVILLLFTMPLYTLVSPGLLSKRKGLPCLSLLGQSWRPGCLQEAGSDGCPRLCQSQQPQCPSRNSPWSRLFELHGPSRSLLKQGILQSRLKTSHHRV